MKKRGEAMTNGERSREAFEKWAAVAFWDDPTDEDAKPSFARKSGGAYYKFIAIQSAWEAWQAASSSMAERAAQIAENWNDKAAEAIRALAPENNNAN
jgi:hypothetical protein